MRKEREIGEVKTKVRQEQQLPPDLNHNVSYEGANVMTNIEVFESASKAQRFARIYAQQHRTSTRVVHQETDWVVRAKERHHEPTAPKPQPSVSSASTQPPTVDSSTLPADEQKRFQRFQLVEDLLHLTDPKEREHRLDALCSQWNGRLHEARKLLKEITDQPQDRKTLSGRLRRRLRARGIHQFDYLSAARRCAQKASQTARAPHCAAVGKHTERGDFWVFVDTLPRYGNPVELIEIYRKADSQVGWWCERLNTPTYIPTWDIELRDPATGDILHIHRRGMSGQAVALRTLSETPNFELIDVVEANGEWAEAIPYDTVEAVIADSEDEQTVQSGRAE
jgi:hypothetical protein